MRQARGSARAQTGSGSRAQAAADTNSMYAATSIGNRDTTANGMLHAAPGSRMKPTDAFCSDRHVGGEEVAQHAPRPTGPQRCIPPLQQGDQRTGQQKRRGDPPLAGGHPLNACEQGMLDMTPLAIVLHDVVSLQDHFLQARRADVMSAQRAAVGIMADALGCHRAGTKQSGVFCRIGAPVLSVCRHLICIGTKVRGSMDLLDGQ
jgi:hypothetical protein